MDNSKKDALIHFGVFAIFFLAILHHDNETIPNIAPRKVSSFELLPTEKKFHPQIPRLKYKSWGLLVRLNDQITHFQ
eukprot:13562439-Ditylum_brightwellii.AAC.1